MNTNDDINYTCQVFTPENYVKQLLDLVNYKHEIFDKYILENSCGDGNILKEIVRRYIADAKANKRTNKSIKQGLSKHIYGFEIDKRHFKFCIDNLNKIALKEGIMNVEWKIFNEDYLTSSLDVEFDYIVGNPPYITYREIKEKNRKFIKKNFDTCKHGKFDYCYAFIEKSIKSLAKNGRMSYLIPSSIFKTTSGKDLRDYMKPHIVKIVDFTKENIFDNVLVKSAIIVLNKQKNSKKLSYTDASKNNEKTILKKDLMYKWVFTKEYNKGKKRFGDYYNVSHSVATLYNKAFVISDKQYNETDGYYVVDQDYIEKESVKKAISPRLINNKKNEIIIFPYSYSNNNLIRFNEDEYKSNYPNTYNYLKKQKKELEKRDLDDGAKWFEYGRSQALSSLNNCKIVLSLIITNKISMKTVDNNYVPYAGVFITLKSKNKKYDLKYAKRVLESKKFMQYVEAVGINISGNSIRVTSKDIENYYF